MRRFAEDPDAPTGAAAGIAFGVTMLAAVLLLAAIVAACIVVGP